MKPAKIPILAIIAVLLTACTAATTEYTSALYLPIVASECIAPPDSDKLGVVGMASDPERDFPALGGEVLHVATLPQCQERGDEYGRCIPYLDSKEAIRKALDGTYDLRQYPLVMTHNEPDVYSRGWHTPASVVADDLWALKEHWAGQQFYGPCIAWDIRYLYNVFEASVLKYERWPPVSGLCWHCYGSYEHCEMMARIMGAIAHKAWLGQGSLILGEFGCPLQRDRTFNQCAEDLRRLTGLLEGDRYHRFYIAYTSRIEMYGEMVPGDWLTYTPLVQDYWTADGVIVKRTSTGDEYMRWPGPTPTPGGVATPIVPDLPPVPALPGAGVTYPDDRLYDVQAVEALQAELCARCQGCCEVVRTEEERGRGLSE